jgi:predicted ATPase
LTLLVEGARDLPERQRTLRATLDWSYGLLAEPERALLARLAVFAGGCGLEDAEAVLGDDVALPLSALVEASLVRRRDSRFTLLETIREYALEKLRAADGADEYHRRHATRFLEVAESAWADILEGGESQEAAFALLDTEQENLHAALAWAVGAADVDTEVRLACAQRWYWLVRGRLNEGVRVFEHAIGVSGDLPAAHAAVLAGAATYKRTPRRSCAGQRTAGRCARALPRDRRRRRGRALHR